MPGGRPWGLNKRDSWTHCARDESGQLRRVVDFPRRSLDGLLIASGERADRVRQKERTGIVRSGKIGRGVSVAASVLDRALRVLVLLLSRISRVVAVTSEVRVSVLELRAANQEGREDPDERKMAAKNGHGKTK